MRQIRLDIDRDAVKAHPAAKPYADGGDLVFRRRAVRLMWPIRSDDPDSDPVFAPFAPNVESVEGEYDPLLKRGHKGTYVLPAAAEIEHHVGNPLAGSMVRIFAAAACVEVRKPIGLDKVGWVGDRSRRVECRMFDQPYHFWRSATANRSRTGFHHLERMRILRKTWFDSPLHRRRIRRRQE